MAFEEGGAAGLFGGDGQQGGGDGGAPGGQQQQGDAGQPGGGDGGDAPGGDAGGADDWLAAFSGDAVGDAPSPRDWVKSKGYKDINALASSARELERQLSGKGVIVRPGENATDDERAAFRTAIGVPDSADKYEVSAAPDGAELDQTFLDPMRQLALDAGVPAEGFKAMADGFVQHQLTLQSAEKDRQDGLRDTKLKEWGADKDRNLTLARRGLEAFGLKIDDVAAIQRGIGSDRFLDLALRMGQVGAEDGLLGSGSGGSFGIASKAEAQSRIDAIIADPAKAAAVKVKGSAEQAEWQRLNKAVAFFTDREAAAER